MTSALGGGTARGERKADELAGTERSLVAFLPPDTLRSIRGPLRRWQRKRDSGDSRGRPSARRLPDSGPCSARHGGPGALPAVRREVTLYVRRRVAGVNTVPRFSQACSFWYLLSNSSLVST